MPAQPRWPREAGEVVIGIWDLIDSDADKLKALHLLIPTLARAWGLGPYADVAVIEARSRRYLALWDELRDDIAKPFRLADTRRCIRMVAAAVELFAESNGRMPTKNEAIETLTAAGVVDAEVLFWHVWDLPAFNKEWRRIGAMPPGLAEVLLCDR